MSHLERRKKDFLSIAAKFRVTALEGQENQRKLFSRSNAGVAELADALDSKSLGREFESLFRNYYLVRTCVILT